MRSLDNLECDLRTNEDVCPANRIPPLPIALQGREPVMLRATITQLLSTFWHFPKIPLSRSFGFSHVQTSIDRGPPDPRHFADRRGGLRHPRDLFDYSTALADAARARPAAQAAILQRHPRPPP